MVIYQGPVRPGYSEKKFRETGESVPLISGPVRPGDDESIFRETGRTVKRDGSSGSSRGGSSSGSSPTSTPTQSNMQNPTQPVYNNQGNLEQARQQQQAQREYNRLQQAQQERNRAYGTSEVIIRDREGNIRYTRNKYDTGSGRLAVENKPQERTTTLTEKSNRRMLRVTATKPAEQSVQTTNQGFSFYDPNKDINKTNNVFTNYNPKIEEPKINNSMFLIRNKEGKVVDLNLNPFGRLTDLTFKAGDFVGDKTKNELKELGLDKGKVYNFLFETKLDPKIVRLGQDIVRSSYTSAFFSPAFKTASSQVTESEYIYDYASQKFIKKASTKDYVDLLRTPDKSGKTLNLDIDYNIKAERTRILLSNLKNQDKKSVSKVLKVVEQAYGKNFVKEFKLQELSTGSTRVTASSSTTIPKTSQSIIQTNSLNPVELKNADKILSSVYAGQGQYERTNEVSNTISDKTNQISFNRMSIQQQPTIQLSLLNQDLNQKSMNRNLTRQLNKTMQQESTTQKMNVNTMTVQNTMQRTKQKQDNQLKKVQQQMQMPKVNYKTATPKKSSFLFIPFKLPKTYDVSQPSNREFLVQGRRYGKFFDLGYAQTQSKAQKIGTDFATKTLGVTYRVKGGPNLKAPTGFKAKKTKEGTEYIELIGRRLKKGSGEIPEIIQAKRSKKR